MKASWLDAAGPAASDIGQLAWLLFAVAAIVYVAVLGLLGYALFRRRAPGPAAEAHAPDTVDSARGGWRALGGVAIVTAVVVAGLLFASLRTLSAVLPAAGDTDPTVEIVGFQWWWAVRYVGAKPEDTVETANELHIPAGRRVTLRLRSVDVIHSFWVPQLQGKLDLVPGKVNVTWLQADRAGIYRGLCAEYCGVQHARMGFLVVAEAPADFAAWLERERRPAAPPADDLARRGERLFVDRGCGSCHAIRGAPASFGKGGPDLTHVASRRTLAAATLTNVPGHLAGWIANPQALKPGNRMPQVPLAPDEVHAVLHYLRGLR